MAEQPGLIGDNNAHTGMHARPTPRPDPLGELRDDLAVVLRVLETRAPVALVLPGLTHEVSAG